MKTKYSNLTDFVVADFGKDMLILCLMLSRSRLLFFFRLGDESIGFLIITIGAMLASALTTISSFEVIFFSKNDKTLFAEVKIFGFEWVLARKHT